MEENSEGKTSRENDVGEESENKLKKPRYDSTEVSVTSKVKYQT